MNGYQCEKERGFRLASKQDVGKPRKSMIATVCVEMEGQRTDMFADDRVPHGQCRGDGTHGT